MLTRLEWQHQTKAPRGVAAMLDGLRFDCEEADWPDEGELESAQYYLHRNQLTLIARHICGRVLPVKLRARYDEFHRANCVRLARLRAATGEVIGELQRAGIEVVLLKGFARADEYVPDVNARMHYDIDLYCPAAAEDAAAVLNGIGWESIAVAESDAAGHLVPLARKTSWKWRGDFFDLETPVHVELHQRLWVPRIEGFTFSGLEKFWDRRESAHGYCTLGRCDTLAFRCMHLLRHLLRGDIRAAGVWEIAYFLHQNRCDDEYWAFWQGLYPQDLQRGQAICFALAQRWFGCEMHRIAQEAADGLPARVRAWMDTSAASPVESFFVPGKDELGLHLALIDSIGVKWRVALRRLVPLRYPARMWEDRGAYFGRLGSRAVYHLKALAPTLVKIVRDGRRH